VAGLIGSDQADIKGVAPAVEYVSLRVLNNYGVGATSNVINAVQWAITNKNTYGIDIINLSLGHPIFEPAATDPLVQAVEAAVRAGIVVVTSAGNMGKNPVTGQVGYAGISSPGNAPSAITVGAMKTQDTTTRADDLVADYSSRGPTWYDGYAKPDVVAPGHRLLGPSSLSQTLYCLLATQRVMVDGRPYLTLSGTSMAAAVTSGSVALMIEGAKAVYGATPTANAVKAMLQHTAFPMSDATGAPYHGFAQGAGALNAAGAAVLSQAINPVATGTNWLTVGVAESTTVDGQNIVWGENIVWGNNIVRGEAIYTKRDAWANNIVWGENIVWGNNIVWGESFLGINDLLIGDSMCSGGLEYM